MSESRQPLAGEQRYLAEAHRALLDEFHVAKERSSAHEHGLLRLERDLLRAALGYGAQNRSGAVVHELGELGLEAVVRSGLLAGVGQQLQHLRVVDHMAAQQRVPYLHIRVRELQSQLLEQLVSARAVLGVRADGVLAVGLDDIAVRVAVGDRVLQELLDRVLDAERFLLIGAHHAEVAFADRRRIEVVRRLRVEHDNACARFRRSQSR